MGARRFDLLVLDLDGTLVDSQDLLVGLVNDVLRDAGCPSAAPAAVAATIGLPLDEVFRRAVPCVADELIDALCVAYRGRADRQEFVQQFRLYPDVAPTLVALRAAGVRLVVGTSKGRATTTDIIKHCGIAECIDEVLGGDSVTRGKPHPEMVHRARALFDTAPHRTLMVGDTSFDIEMGQGARVATCAVTYGMHPAAALRELRPDFVIDQFEQISVVVDGTTLMADTFRSP
jgi:phosphoglycolate phosphatase